jgi:hypothetical protein
MFAWFDFTAESLCWHLNIMKELYDLYSHHPSFYGWYISEEMAATLDVGTSFFNPKIESLMTTFFATLRQAAAQMNPVMPVSFAINTDSFDRYAANWTRIWLGSGLDICLPFGFTRIPSSSSIKSVLQAASQTPTTIWIDMEVRTVQIDMSGRRYVLI